MEQQKRPVKAGDLIGRADAARIIGISNGGHVNVMLAKFNVTPYQRVDCYNIYLRSDIERAANERAKLKVVQLLSWLEKAETRLMDLKKNLNILIQKAL